MILLTAKHAEKPQSMLRKTICKLNWHTASNDNNKGGIMAYCFCHRFTD